MYFFGTHVIAQTQDIMTGVVVGNDAKETNIQKYARWQRKGILTKGLLENQRGREKKAGNQKLLPYKMILKNAI